MHHHTWFVASFPWVDVVLGTFVSFGKKKLLQPTTHKYGLVKLHKTSCTSCKYCVTRN
jgi:hypothetical protein